MKMGITPTGISTAIREVALVVEDEEDVVPEEVPPMVGTLGPP